MKSTNLILIGGGHAHTYLINKLRDLRQSEIKATLISSNRYQYYSGMYSGFIEGLYTLDEIRIDLKKICQMSGVQFIEDQVLEIDPENQYVITKQGKSLSYDVISLDIGSHSAGLDTTPGASKFALQIKPNYRIPEVKAKLENDTRDDEIRSLDSEPSTYTSHGIIIIGGGASGIELSLSIKANYKKKGKQQQVYLISSESIMAKSGGLVSNKLRSILRRKGVQYVEHNPVIHVDAHHITLQTGETLVYDKLLWLTGSKAPPMIKSSNLAVDSRGYMSVNHYLQSTAYDNVFGAGDCISIKDYENIDKAGVYAVRESPYLWRNIYHYIKSIPMVAYKPQDTYLSILSTGYKEAFLMYKGFSFHGKWCWIIKDINDRSFVKKYT